MLTILQHSLNSIIDLYKLKDKEFYNFSFLFLLFTNCIATVLCIIVLYLASSFYQLGEFGVQYSFFELMLQPAIWLNFKNCNLYFTTASIGLYACYLQTVLSNPEEKMSMANFFNFMNSKHWTRYSIIMSGLVLFYSVTFVELFEVAPVEQEGILGIVNSFGDFEQDNEWNEFYQWLNSVIQLAGMFLPYFAAFLIVLWNEYPEMNISILKIFRKYIWICIVIAFCLLSLSNNLIYYINEYLIKLFAIPFKERLVEHVVSTLMSWLIIIVFYPAFAGAILFPMLKTKENNENAVLDLIQEDKIE